MNKNSIIGLVLIGLIMFGFSWYQSKQYEEQAAIQAQQDSIAYIQKLQQIFPHRKIAGCHAECLHHIQ